MTKAKVLEESESLFFAKGFKATALKEICSALKIKPASLYYHFPQGKEQIYVEVVHKRMINFKKAIEDIGFRASSLEQALTNFGLWYIEQPKMNMTIITDLDLNELSPKFKKIVRELVRAHVFEPLGQLFRDFESDLRKPEPVYLFVSIIANLFFSIHTSAKMGHMEAKDLVVFHVDLFLNGAGKTKK